MITLSFTEEDRTLLLNLSSIQRDRVFFALLAGGGGSRGLGGSGTRFLDINPKEDCGPEKDCGQGKKV